MFLPSAAALTEAVNPDIMKLQNRARGPLREGAPQRTSAAFGTASESKGGSAYEHGARLLYDRAVDSSHTDGALEGEPYRAFLPALRPCAVLCALVYTARVYYGVRVSPPEGKDVKETAEKRPVPAEAVYASSLPRRAEKGLVPPALPVDKFREHCLRAGRRRRAVGAVITHTDGWAMCLLFAPFDCLVVSVTLRFIPGLVFLPSERRRYQRK